MITTRIRRRPSAISRKIDRDLGRPDYRAAVAHRTVAVATVVILASCGSPMTTELDSPPSPAAATASRPVAQAEPTPTAAMEPPEHWIGEPAHWMGPPDPQVGISYPFDLLTHCEINTTRFGGRYWQATPPRPEPDRRPGPDGIIRDTGYTAGTMTLLGNDLLRFVITDPQSAGDGESVDFTPLPTTASPPPPCL